MPRKGKHYYSPSPVRCNLEHNPPCRLDHTPHQEACFKKGETHYQSGKYAIATIMYKAALDFEPANQLYLASAKLADALASEKVDKLEIAHLNKNKGDILYEAKNYQDALKYYSRAVEFAPNQSIFYYHKANSLYSLRNYQEASHCYSTAITFAPDDPRLYWGQGLALASLPNKQKDSIAALDKAATLYNAMTEYDAMTDKALECYDKIIEIHPQNAYAYCNKGNIFYAEKKYQEALKCYNATVNISALGCVKDNNYSYSSYSRGQDIDQTQVGYHYIDAYIGKSKILDILADSKELAKSSSKFTKILAKFYENKLYQEINAFFDNNVTNIVLGYATGTEKLFNPLDITQTQITEEIIEIALTGVVE